MASILVSSQEATTRSLVVDVLTDMGHRVRAARELDKAVQLAHTEYFDVLILDPGTSDPEVLESIVQSSRSRNACAAVVALDRGHSVQTFAAGDRLRIAKPFSIGSLIRAVHLSLLTRTSSLNAESSRLAGDADMEELCRLPLREALEQFERAYFRHHFAAADGCMSLLAERVGLDRTHLYRKLLKLGVKGGSVDAELRHQTISTSVISPLSSSRRLRKARPRIGGDTPEGASPTSRK